MLAPSPVDTRATELATELATLLDARALRCVYQPLVDLTSGRALGHEALLRGPRGSALESPLALLDTARGAGLLGELEQASLRHSLHDAGARSGGRPMTLFVNVEPSTLTERLDVVLAAVAGRPAHVQVVVEITERALAADPAGILAAADQLRRAGCALALDDVGAEPASLAFIPLLRPEVVKLDLGLLRTLDDPMTITVAGAVRAYAEASGAEVVAEGIEVEDDLTRALVLGATLGQGWLWGRPDETLAPALTTLDRFAAHAAQDAPAATPFDVVAGNGRLSRVPKRLLLPLSQTLELTALQSRVPPMLLSCFQEARHLTPATGRRYTALAAQLPFVGVLGVAMPSEPVPAVRGTALDPDDPLALEWTVVVLGAHESVALVARGVAPTRSDVPRPRHTDGEREFDFLVTHDRARVTAVAHSLLARITPR